MKKSFLNLSQNDSFHVLRGLDLRELLFEIEKCRLKYADTLRLPKEVTFGVEIEYEKVSRDKVNRFIKRNLDTWISKGEYSLLSGGELNSPKMTDKYENWQELKQVCDFLKRKGADTRHNAGGHIHIGSNILKSDIKAWQIFSKIYMLYESVLFRFLYGDKLNGRHEILDFAYPIADYIYFNLENINNAECMQDIRKIFPDNKLVALNTKHIDFKSDISPNNTLEFRSPNSSTNAIIWQNDINALAKMVVTSSLKIVDEDFLDYKINHDFLPYSGNEYLYSVIDLKKVLEFVDLIFDNNIDKIYFLRQYFKNFQGSYDLKEAVSAKKFTR